MQTLKGRISAKMKLIIFSIIMIFLAQSIIAGVPQIDWYDVEDWELDVCQMWGGVDEANQGTTSGEIYLSQMVITLQAEKKVFMLDESQYTTQYKIGWYIAPYQEDYTYTVELISGLWLEEEGEAKQGAGQSGFKAFYENDTVYTEAVLEYCDEDYNCGTLTVPVVE